MGYLEYGQKQIRTTPKVLTMTHNQNDGEMTALNTPSRIYFTQARRDRAGRLKLLPTLTTIPI